MKNIGIYNVKKDRIEPAPIEPETWYAIYSTDEYGNIEEIDAVPEKWFAMSMCLLWIAIYFAGFITATILFI